MELLADPLPRRGAEAQENLTTAATLYRDMDVRFWLPPADAELKELARHA
jgi:hypothetical protein